MCCRSAAMKPILLRKEMKTATPPNGVTARSVSRRINRSSDNRAVISRGTGLSVAFDSIPLLSQIRGGNPALNFGFQVERNLSAATRCSRIFDEPVGCLVSLYPVIRPPRVQPIGRCRSQFQSRCCEDTRPPSEVPRVSDLARLERERLHRAQMCRF